MHAPIAEDRGTVAARWYQLERDSVGGGSDQGGSSHRSRAVIGSDDLQRRGRHRGAGAILSLS
jgi:hypothetical protein